MGEISMLLKAADTKATHFLNMHASKSKSKVGPQSGPVTSSMVSSGMSKASTAVSKHSPTKVTQLPVRKGSSLNRSFPKVTDSENSVLKNQPRQKEASTDSGFRSGSLQDFTKTLTELEKQPECSQNGSPRASNHSMLSEDVWSSPNTSSYCPSSSGLMEKLDKFKFADTVGTSKKEMADELRDMYKIKNSAGKTGHREYLKYDNFAQKDREKTPPPDGQLNKDKKTSVNIRGVTPQLNRKFSDGFKSDMLDVRSSDILGVPTVKGNVRESPVHDKRLLDSDMEWSRLDGSGIDHGYMPGHHIPDGTEYSQRSDYAHINHKGELREVVAGLDDVGLVESRGFDVLKDKNKNPNDLSAESKLLQHHSNVSAGVTITSDDQNTKFSVSTNKLSTNLQPTQSKSPMIRATSSDQSITSHIVTQGQNVEDLKNVETQTNKSSKKLESWTQTSVVVCGNESTQFEQTLGEKKAQRDETESVNRDKDLNVSGIPPQLPISSFKHNLLPNNQSAVSDKPNLLTKQSLMQTDFAQDNLRRDYSVKVLDRIYSRNSMVNADNFQTMNATSSDSYFHPAGRESLESNTDWQILQGRETLDTLGKLL